ncbi:MAG TPA: GIY-YIG nuclease family protein [Acidimicrobiales bacterium]|nr:GIY-YIG nuclease family protein [Acidimicrobiales bacterium]
MATAKAHRSGGGEVPAAVRQLPHGPGVYRFVDGRGRLLYVGRAVDLRRRVASYWGDLGGRGHLRRMVAAVKRVQAVLCASEHEAAWLERNLLDAYKPRANRSCGGQEVPTFIALSSARAAPCLKAVHRPLAGHWRHFGPYLGGDRARLALSGLDRVYCLPYSGERLTGSERDMARARGVSPFGRADLVQSVCAVLERQPIAMAHLEAELTGHRDRAAKALAFELARRVQDEIDALQWLLSPQRVTLLEPCDLDVYGWDHGPLVHFSVRGGKLSTWKESSTTARRAQGLTDATPVEWADFAQENAVLAARLARATVI